MRRTGKPIVKNAEFKNDYFVCTLARLRERVGVREER
jgi:hypothetical protein